MQLSGLGCHVDLACRQDLHGVVGGRNVGLQTNSDLSVYSDSVRRNVDVMAINAAKIH